jgi:predicted TIM-barrel fold metal-dependent hydrolase
MTIIDIHPYVISTDTRRHPLMPLGGTQSTWSRDRPTPFEKLVTAMDAAGVDKAALVQASTAYGHDNSYVAEAIAAYPNRFTGVFSIDVLAHNAVQTMRQWLDLGFSGMRLFTTGSTMPGQSTWFDDPRSFPAWDYASNLGVPICMQMTRHGIPQLRGIADRFPSARIILDHCARPHLIDGAPYESDKALFDLARYPNIFLKITPLNFTPPEWGKATAESFFRKLVDAFGASRIAWGSNFPAAEGSLTEILWKARAALLSLDPDDRAWIFGKTAETLYPILNV